MQSGLVDYWISKYSPTISAKDKCRDSRSRNELRKLNLEDLQSAFLLLAIGLLLAAVAFLLEVFHYAITSKSRLSRRKAKMILIRRRRGIWNDIHR